MAKEVFCLTIKVLDDGTTTLSGPLDNKTLCYGLLEAAKDSVREHSQKKEPAKAAMKLDFDIGNAMVKNP